jgi:hypothetical protein
MTAPTELKQTPPYGPLSTFTTFIGSLKTSAIPSHIDASIMQRMSGTAISQVRGTLRFLGLTTDSGAVTPKIRTLVEAYETEAWKDTWMEVLFDAYQSIIGELDLDTATLKQLVDRFRDAGLSGSVLRKSVRFYLDGVKESGAAVSPHLNARGLSIVSGDRVAKPRTGKTPPAGTPRVPDVTPASNQGHLPPAEHVLIHVPNRAPFAIPLPNDLKDAEWNYIDGQIRAYMSLRKQK